MVKRFVAGRKSSYFFTLVYLSNLTTSEQTPGAPGNVDSLYAEADAEDRGCVRTLLGGFQPDDRPTETSFGSRSQSLRPAEQNSAWRN